MPEKAPQPVGAKVAPTSHEAYAELIHPRVEATQAACRDKDPGP